MSSVGLEWYKREPVAYLKDTQGLSAREHAVYGVVLDLIYQNGGSISNDPGWISGWISDMGSAAVRNAIASLDANPKITLVITETEISQKRARNEVKTKQKQKETASKNGSIGGVSSGKKRAANSKNKDLGEGEASPDTQTEKRREEKIEEESKASSSKKAEADFYDRYLAAHPKPVESYVGELAFEALVADGESPQSIIASAAAYAETVSGWSAEAKVQQSDNFLDPDRGKWREHVAKPKQVFGSADHVAAVQKALSSPVASVREHAEKMVQKLKERGIAA